MHFLLTHFESETSPGTSFEQLHNLCMLFMILHWVASRCTQGGSQGQNSHILTYPLFGGVLFFSHWLNHPPASHPPWSSQGAQPHRCCWRCCGHCRGASRWRCPTELRGGSMGMGRKMTEEPGPSPNSCGWVVL